MKCLFLSLITCSIFIGFICVPSENNEWSMRRNRLLLHGGPSQKGRYISCPKKMEWVLTLLESCHHGNRSKIQPLLDLGEINPKRSTHHQSMKCSCFQGYRTLELGPKYFPRVLTEARCSPEMCGRRPYTCKGIVHKFPVLMLRNKSEGVSMLLPPALREEYLLVDVAVTVACECVI